MFNYYFISLTKEGNCQAPPSKPKHSPVLILEESINLCPFQVQLDFSKQSPSPLSLAILDIVPFLYVLPSLFINFIFLLLGLAVLEIIQ
ncbi:hypothetical protein A9G38_06055 [Gilliamella sp. Imp1-1]|nr:hypothetical protein A9G38_06055 [Gilliamella apicola]